MGARRGAQVVEGGAEMVGEGMRREEHNSSNKLTRVEVSSILEKYEINNW